MSDSANPIKSFSYAADVSIVNRDDVGSGDGSGHYTIQTCTTNNDMFLKQESNRLILNATLSNEEEAPRDSQLNNDICDFINKNLSDLQR